MEISQLNESINKSFYNKTFFKLAKENRQELGKMFSQYMREKSMVVSGDQYDNKPVSFKKFHEKISPEAIKALKDIGFLGIEIENIWVPGVSTVEKIKSLIANNISYNSNPDNYSNKDFKDYLSNPANKDKILNDIIAWYKKSKTDLVKGTANVKVGEKFFSITKDSSSGIIEFPIIWEKDKKLKVQIETNDSFFEDGHDLKIMIAKNDSFWSGQTFSYKINLMRPFNDVMNEIISKINESINSSDGGEEKKPYRQDRAYIKDDFSRMAEIYLKKWFVETKTGKKKEAPEGRMPAHVFISTADDHSKKSSSYKKPAYPSYILNIKTKTAPVAKANEKSRYSRNTIIPAAVKELYPDIEKWWSKLEPFRREVDSSIPYSIDGLWPSRIHTDDHEKFFERIQFFMGKVAGLGYYPAEVSKAYKSSEYDKITFKYSDKVKEIYDKDSKKAIDQILNSKYAKKVEDIYYGGVRLQHVPRRILSMIFDANLKKIR